MNKDEFKGKAKQVKGSIKQKAGEVTDNPDLEAEGAIDQAAGKVQEGFGAAKRKTREFLDDVTDEDEE
jgi:uncharacterized protein YjbJ (UPF0337 family)